MPTLHFTFFSNTKSLQLQLGKPCSRGLEQRMCQPDKKPTGRDSTTHSPSLRTFTTTALACPCGGTPLHMAWPPRPAQPVLLNKLTQLPREDPAESGSQGGWHCGITPVHTGGGSAQSQPAPATRTLQALERSGEHGFQSGQVTQGQVLCSGDKLFLPTKNSTTAGKALL